MIAAVDLCGFYEDREELSPLLENSIIFLKRIFSLLAVGPAKVQLCYGRPKSFVRMKSFVRKDSFGILSHNPNRIAIGFTNCL